MKEVKMYVKYDDVIALMLKYEFITSTELMPTRKPSHGPCCTCQTCGQSHDECVCEHNELITDLRAITKYKNDTCSACGIDLSCPNGCHDTNRSGITLM